MRPPRLPDIAGSCLAAVLTLAGLLAGLPAAAANDLFVLDRLAKDVKQYDATTGAFLGSFGDTARELSSVRAMAFHPGSGDLFVADALGVQVFDGDTGAFLGSFGETADHLTRPVDLEFRPDTQDLWVVENFNQVGADFFDGDVRAFDGTTGQFLGSVGDSQENLRFPLDLAFHPLQDTFLVGGQHPVPGGADVGVWEFDLSTGDFIGAFGETSDFDVNGPLAFDPATNNLVVRLDNDVDLRVFNELGQVVDLLAAGLMRPEKLAFHPGTGALLVADGMANQITVVDADTGQAEGVFGETGITLGEPVDLAFQPIPTPEPGALGAVLACLLLGVSAARAGRACPSTRYQAPPTQPGAGPSSRA